MSMFVQDLRHALRALRQSPGFAAVAVLTLALGIGATTAVFSLVDGVLLRPLPYAYGDRLFALYEATPGGDLRLASYPTFRDWREQSDAFEGMAYIRGEVLTLRGDDGAQRLLGAYVSPGFFDVLRARPLVGRVLGAVDHEGEAGLVVLSHHLWRQAFGGDPGVIGRTLDTFERAHTVIGVMPPGIDPLWTDLWLPLSARPADAPVFTRRDLHVDSRVLARLEAGVTVERAEAEMEVIARGLSAAYREDAAEWTAVRLVPLREEVLGDVGPRLLVLAAAVALVLLIACTNVAGLMLARAAGRARELAVRAALGAGRRDLVRHLLAEALVLGLAGGVLGVLLADAGVGLLAAIAPDALPRLDGAAVDGRALAFTLAISLATAFAAGLAPALSARGSDVVSALKSGTSGGGVDRRRTRLRATLVVAETAMALVLLVGAALLIKSLWLLQRERVGFEPDRAAAVRIYPPSPRYDDDAAAAMLYRRLEAAAAAVPGVERAAVANHVPLGGPWMPTRVSVPGWEPSADPGSLVLYRTISTEYFATLGVPLLQGRDFAPADLGPGGVAVVNQTFAERYFSGRDPVGQALTVTKAAQGRPDFGEPMPVRIVGIVGDVRALDLDRPPVPTIYVPYTANPWDNTFVIARTAGDPARVIPALRRALLEVDPDLPLDGPGRLTQLRPMREYVGRWTQERELQTGLLGGFAASALLLALLGIFGLLAYHVAQRTREIGVRVALGAGRADVLRLIVGQGLRLVAAGVALGLLGALAATRVLRGLLYGVSATDPAAFFAAAVLFTAVALLTGSIAARRALRVDPMVALRQE